MKNPKSLFVILILLLLLACAKFRTSPYPDPPYNISTTPATIDNLKNSTDTSYLSFVPLDTITETVSFFITGLPPGITIDSSQATRGTPPFNTIIAFKNNGTANPGTYNLKVNCFSTTTRSYRAYDLSLNVLPVATGSNCAARASGYWLRCRKDIDTTIYSDQATIDATDSNRIIFGNGNNMGYPLSADLNCSNNSISIAHIIRIDDSGRHYFSGLGTFSANLITYSFQDSTITRIHRYNVTMRR